MRDIIDCSPNCNCAWPAKSVSAPRTPRKGTADEPQALLVSSYPPSGRQYKTDTLDNNNAAYRVYRAFCEFKQTNALGCEPMNGQGRGAPQRHRLAYEAARILAEHGDQAFDRARRKAAERLGVSNRREWPSNEEIHAALLAQRRLFQGERIAADLRYLREQAALAMGALAQFMPRLVGPVLSGTGDLRAGIRLHLFADSPEELVFALVDQGIPWEEGEETLRYSGGRRLAHPTFAFVAGEIPFTLVVLPPQTLRNPPLDPVTERPERGADLGALRTMLETTPTVPVGAEAPTR